MKLSLPQVLDGLKTGNDALKKANAMFSIEEIEAIMDDTAEAVAKQREIDDLLSGQLTAEDEDDVLKELEALADLEDAEAVAAGSEDVKLPDVPTTDLPGESVHLRFRFPFLRIAFLSLDDCFSGD